MREGIQNLLSEIGQAGCLALCICELGKPGLSEGEAVDSILEGIQRGYIDYDEANTNNPTNLFVRNRDALMELVTGQEGWVSSTEKPDYTLQDGERSIECWRWNEITKDKPIVHTHFRLPHWDPYRTSKTRTYGYLESLRVFRRYHA